MIRLASTDLLSLVTAQNGAEVIASYNDRTATAYGPGNTQVTDISSATTTTILSSPAASTVREPDEISIKNTFAGSHTMTLNFNRSATLYGVWTVTLLENERIAYTHAGEWVAMDANGNRKEVTSSNFGGITVTSLTDSGLTSGRVVLASTGGLLADDADLTFSGATLTAHTLTVSTGALTVTGGTITTGAATALSLATTGGTQVKIINSAAPTSFVELSGSSAGTPAVNATTGVGGATVTTTQTEGNSVRTYNFINSHATQPLGIRILYSAVSPNGTGNVFLLCDDSSATRATIRSNGGLANFQANNVDLSDASRKVMLGDAPDFRSFVKQLSGLYKPFRYDDASTQDELHGPTVQDIEPFAPELVTMFDERSKGIYTHRLQQRINSVIPQILITQDAHDETLEDLKAFKARAIQEFPQLA